MPVSGRNRVQFSARVLDDASERRLAGVERTVAPIRIRNPPTDIARSDFEEMSVGPSERSLQRLVQAIEPDGERNLETAHDLRFDVVESDLEAGDGCGGQAASLRRS